MKKSLLLLSVLALMGCEKIDNMMNMPNKMDDLGSTTKDLNAKTGDMGLELKKTSKAIHSQILLLSLQGLLDSKNWDVLEPAPLKMMPFGKTFAEEATAQEMIEFTYATMLEIKETKQEKGKDLLTDANVDFSANEAAEIVKEKKAKHMMLKIIAGFTQDEKVKEMISVHIRGNNSDGSRRFQETALAFLAMRAQFLNEILIEASILRKPLSNIGLVEEAIKYTTKLDWISKLNFADKIECNLKTSVSYVDSSNQPQTVRVQLSNKLDPAGALEAWNKIKLGIQNDLQIVDNAIGENSHDNDFIVSNEKVRARNAENLVDKYIQSWQGHQP
jgi:hypothetical protein